MVMMMMKRKRDEWRCGDGSCVMLILSCLTMLTKGKRLEVAKTIAATQGDEIFALGCPGLTPSFDSVIWLLNEENTLVGAGVHYNHQKYRYYASTGNLAIRNVDLEDSGIYRCLITYGKGDKTIDLRHETRAVELIVRQPYRDLWEEEYKSNMIRGLIAAGVAACLVTAACTVYKYRWKSSKYMPEYSEELQLVSGLDNLGLELEHQRKSKDRGRGSFSISTAAVAVGLDPPTPPPPPSTSALVHIEHI